MKSDVGRYGFIGDIPQDKKQDEIATEDERIVIIDQDF